MPKLSKKSLSEPKLGYLVNNLWSAFTLMDSKEDIRLFFRSLFTHTEYKMLAKRFEVARRLIRGDKYESISRDLNISQKTISLISNILQEKGEGFIRADSKLHALDQRFQNIKKNRQKQLERRGLPKLPGSDVLPNLIVEGLKVVDKVITKANKTHSAAKDIDL